jgi:hypothetical protein
VAATLIRPYPLPAADELPMWVIYSRARDYPGRFVVRRFVTGPGGREVRDPQLWANEPTLELARQALPPGLVCFARNPADDSAIEEVWL